MLRVSYHKFPVEPNDVQNTGGFNSCVRSQYQKAMFPLHQSYLTENDSFIGVSLHSIN